MSDQKPKFKAGDIVTPKTYLISGEIECFWYVRGGYRYTIIFEDWAPEDFNEKDLFGCIHFKVS